MPAALPAAAALAATALAAALAAAALAAAVAATSVTAAIAASTIATPLATAAFPTAIATAAIAAAVATTALTTAAIAAATIAAAVAATALTTAASAFQLRANCPPEHYRSFGPGDRSQCDMQQPDECDVPHLLRGARWQFDYAIVRSAGCNGCESNWAPICLPHVPPCGQPVLPIQ